MKYPLETEKEFLERVEREKAKGICVFRDDRNREMILDIIDNYIDLCDALSENLESEGTDE